MARAKHRKGHRGLAIGGVVVGVLLLLSAGTAYAAYRYDASTSDRILDGVTVAGIDLGGMTREEAERTLTEQAEETLYGELVINAAGHTWTVTPASMGMTVDIETAVDQAFAVADEMSFVSRLYHRLQDVPVDESFELAYDSRRSDVKAFVEQAFNEVAVPAVNARFAIVESQIQMRRSRTGQELQTRAATQGILGALANRTSEVDVPVRTLEPEVTTASLGQTIVVDLSENHLTYYEGLKVVKEYAVATGTPGYPTPAGTWEIVLKRENPTWYNPAQDTWGAGMPAVIGPGPGNPLGTRALNLNAPGIRIHGTYDAFSIGTYASHGCIRMHIADVEELYELVDVGARVLITP
jgi:lipoprotein-anchoring transpeptidase ErfK/SrfK